MQNLSMMNQEQEEDRLVPSAFHTIVYGGLLIGLLDGCAALLNAGVRGVPPNRVFQYISSALLGPESFNGGSPTVILGAVLHFVVAFGVAIGFYLLARTFPVVLRTWWISGILYGVATYLVMNYLILPLSGVRQAPFSWNGFLVAILIHILFVGLPVAFIARRYAKGSEQSKRRV